MIKIFIGSKKEPRNKINSSEEYSIHPRSIVIGTTTSKDAKLTVTPEFRMAIEPVPLATQVQNPDPNQEKRIKKSNTLSSNYNDSILDKAIKKPQNRSGNGTYSRSQSSLTATICTFMLLGVTADDLNEDILELQRSTNNLISVRHQSQQDFERMYRNLIEIQARVDDQKIMDLERFEWIPSHLSTIATLLHQIINVEETARSRMKDYIQRSGIRNMQHIHESFRALRKSRKSKRNTTQQLLEFDDIQDHQTGRDSRFVKELKSFFKNYDETHRPNARAQQFSLEIQGQFDGNLEDLRPIQILMGRSDTSDIRAMEDTWMKEIAKLPESDLIKGSLTEEKVSPKVVRTINEDGGTTRIAEKTTSPTTTIDVPTQETPESDLPELQTISIDDITILLEELQSHDSMPNPQEKNVELDHTCIIKRPKGPIKGFLSLYTAICSPYAFQANNCIKSKDKGQTRIRELDCHVNVNARRILNITMQTETLIKGAIEAK